MNDNEKIAKVKEIFADKDFVAKVMEMETAEEVQAAVKEKGVELSLDEITAAREQLIKMQENGEELDDSQLEQVAGGFAIAGTLFLIGMGVLVGGSIGVGIGAAVRENRESRGRRW